MSSSPHPQYITHSISTGTIIKIILVLFLAALFFYLRDVVLIFLTAVVIASAIEPGTRQMVRRGVPRVLAVVIIYAILIVIIIGLSYLIIPSFISDLARFTNMLPNYVTTLDVRTHSDLSDNLSGWQSAILGLSKSESLAQAVQNFTLTLSTASGSVLATLTAVFGGLTSFVLVLVLSFYLAVQEHGIEDFLRLIIPLKQENYVISLWRRTQHKIGRWIQGQLLLAVVIGVLVFVGLSLLHVKNAFFLALVSTVFEIIPVFGPFLGSVPGVLTAFLQDGFTFALIVAIMYLIVQQIESNVIYPIVVQKVLNVQPLVVMISLIVGAELGGFLGILLAVPVAVAITEIVGDLRKNRSAAREKVEALEL